MPNHLFQFVIIKFVKHGLMRSCTDMYTHADTDIQRVHHRHLATIYTHNAHKAWQAQVCLSCVGNSCWHIWDSQMSREHFLSLAQPAGHTCTRTNCDFLTASTLHSFSLPTAFPTGLILQVDGKERRADCVCGGQRHLPQTHVTATGLFLPLQ